MKGVSKLDTSNKTKWCIKIRKKLNFKVEVILQTKGAHDGQLKLVLVK